MASLFRRITLLLICFLLNQSLIPAGESKNDFRKQARKTLLKAGKYYHSRVANHGGYVYHYSLDLKQRWGEGIATSEQIWVQPPGTPTVGMAYLKAHQATKNPFFLQAAKDAATAVMYGQLQSGGWTNKVDFNHQTVDAQYRNGNGSKKGKNNSSLDDGQSQSAIRFLILADEAFQFKNQSIHQSVSIALDALLAAQFPNGGFPQVWTEPVEVQLIKKANYPQYDWRTEGRIKNYWDMYTLNDNVTGFVAETLLEAHRVYGGDKYAQALRRLGNFLLLAQMPEPQPAWAQQYNYNMQPIWARKFEPPAIASDESQEALETLIKIYRLTGDRKYLKPFPQALGYLKKSILIEGKLARYYELRTNKPLYMNRSGKRYSLTYNDANLPAHYGWKIESRIKQINTQYQQAILKRKQQISSRDISGLKKQVEQIIKNLDEQSRWVSQYNGERLVGQPKFPLNAKYLSSEVFSQNLELLSDYLIATKPN